MCVAPRSLEGKLRIGLAEQSVLHALALAVATTPPGPDLQLDAAQHMSADKFKVVHRRDLPSANFTSAQLLKEKTIYVFVGILAYILLNTSQSL